MCIGKGGDENWRTEAESREGCEQLRRIILMGDSLYSYIIQDTHGA